MSNEKKLLHWADQTAEKIIRERGDLDVYTCASGITPSGTVHVGNFREIISVDLVVRALRSRGKNVRFIYSWDDYDVFRKVPLNMPKPEVLEKYLRYPITMVPDTFERDENYARHHEHDVESVLPRVGIHPEYLYQAERYQKGMYAEGMKKALDNREELKEILNTYRDESHKITEEYWPVSVFCTVCNKDTTKIESWDNDWTLRYSCECGHCEDLDLRRAKSAKLGWRVDWPMRWAFEKTVFEPAGKDHHSQGGSFDTASLVSTRIYNWPAPVSFRYDFIGLKGVPGKMASSKGKVVSLAEVLEVYQPEVARYLFAGTRPNTEFVISFDLDVIKIYEDYDKTERIAWKAEQAKNDETFEKEYRIYELSQIDGMPECISYQIPFRHLCNLLQINSGDIEAVIKGLPDVKPAQLDRLKTRAECAWNWITDGGAPEEFKFALRTDGSKADLNEAETKAIKTIRDSLLPKMDEMDEKTFSTALYDAAKECGLEPKQMFVACYQALVSKDQGPRLAGFMKTIGKERLENILKNY
ncbi:lysine--tRNA ligase [Treponema sp. OMZ 787]|uniref:lysine--tRNA ligase n=1 Tax=Treponema sp. OMZ 787 TaxID=2563669 RepID=UPI0020A371F1|nr:lysine--tRNA ligase [Treponema sp. OMZ 787]UTC63082.1 lysine--tRNA ligase [Treponema sp. OMZ 787]